MEKRKRMSVFARTGPVGVLSVFCFLISLGREKWPFPWLGNCGRMGETDGTLFKHLSEIDRACNERMEVITTAMAKQEGVTEALKADDQMKWVRRMNNIRNRAEEVVLRELVYD